MECDEDVKQREDLEQHPHHDKSKEKEEGEDKHAISEKSSIKGIDEVAENESFEMANGSNTDESWETVSDEELDTHIETEEHHDGICKCTRCMGMAMAQSLALTMRISDRSQQLNSDLPETVTRLEMANGSAIYLVGTAHFSETSQDEVAQTIRAVCPDVVMVELCQSRVGILQYDEETLLREAKDISVKKLRFAVKESGVVSGVMQLLLLSMSAHLTKQLGMAPGGEFRRAVKEAKKIAGCQILLGDRPIQVTLSRAMAALSVWQKLKLAWYLITSRDPISKEDVEKYKQKDMLAEMLAEMTGDFPRLTEVFVSERDKYMAHTLRNTAVPLPLINGNGDYQRSVPSVVVGVVGMGHANGIAENINADIDITELLRIPEPSATGRTLKLTFKAVLVAAVSWSLYRILKWANVL